MAVSPHQDGLISGISPVVDRWRQGVEKLANEAGMVRVEIRIKGMLKRPFGKHKWRCPAMKGRPFQRFYTTFNTEKTTHVILPLL